VLRLESYGERIAAAAIRARGRARGEAAPRIARSTATARRPAGRHGGAASRAGNARASCGVASPSRATATTSAPIAPYCYLAAQQGFATIIGSNSTHDDRAHRRARGALGNSPLGFGVPARRRPDHPRHGDERGRARQDPRGA
jgi:hypothetical protein